MSLTVLKRIALLAIVAVPSIGASSQQRSASLDMEPPSAVQHAIRLGAADTSRVLHLAVSMPYADESAMQEFVDSVSDPSSPNYRHFLTPEQVGQRFGLPQSQIRKVVSFLQSQGMKVTLVGKNRLTVLADATVGQAQKAFNTSIEQFVSTKLEDAADPYRFAFTSTPTVPAELGGIVTAVSGMEDFTRPKKSYLSPSQARTLYGTASMYSGGMRGQGRTIGISSWDGFRLSNASAFISYYALPVPTAGALTNVKVETIDGGSGTGTQKVEGDMDIQCSLAIAPLANIIVYDGYGGDLINVLTLEVNDNTADIITESYGWGLAASTATSAHTLHLSMSAQGITYLAASGDTGTTLTYPYPGCEPEVLVVGGTSTTTDTTGNRTTETGWSGSGGGWSTTVTNTFNVKPSYQSAVGPSGVNYRLFPDIAATADPTTGYTMYLAAGTYPTFTLSSSGVYNGFGGTSAASPTMAASLAIAEEQIIAGGGLAANSSGKQRFGRINDLLYSYNGLSSIFFDVTSGSNGTLPSGSTSTAVAGWDTVTGWGALNFQGLVSKVLGMSVSSVSLSASTIEGGNGTTLTGTVKISAAAPASGQVVTLTSSSASVTVPASVTVASGATSATFNVTTKAVGTNSSATITATTAGSSATATLALTPPHPTSVTLASSSVTGGVSTTGTVNIAEAAPTGGVVVTLSSSNTSAATVPTSVTVAAGATSATFTVTTSAVASSASATITATSGNGSATASITVAPATVSALSLSSTSAYGGLTSAITGTVTLTGPAPSSGTTVALSTSSTSTTLSASSITIAAGKTSGTFTFTAAAVSATTTATITATVGTAKATATFTINPAILSAVSLSASSVVGGVTNPTVTVTLNAPAGPSGTVVTLASSVTTAANFTAGSVTVAAGKTTATATLTSFAVNSNASVTITGTASVSKTAALTVTAATLSSLTLSTTSLTGNGTTAVTGTVTLSGPAGPAGVTITLKSSNGTAVPVPASVTIAAGAKTGTFTFKPATVTTSTKVTITATLGTTSVTATLTDV